jgi:hypothetical protein
MILFASVLHSLARYEIDELLRGIEFSPGVWFSADIRIDQKTETAKTSSTSAMKLDIFTLFPRLTLTESDYVSVALQKAREKLPR